MLNIKSVVKLEQVNIHRAISEQSNSRKCKQLQLDNTY